MARNTNIKLRRSATAAAIPTTSNLDLGELALNTNDGKLYMKTTEGSLDSVIQVGSATDTYFKIRRTVNQNFTVTVASKTTDHVYHGSGSSAGYIINGIEAPHLNFVPGNSYQFDQSDGSNSGHPLRFYYDAAKTTAYTTGVTTNGTAGSSGAYTKIVPTKDTPMVLYYQCSAHGFMGGSVSFATRNLTGFDTDELGEGTSNLYYTNARADARIALATGANLNLGSKDTDDLSEGSSNLYHTSARAISAVTGSNLNMGSNSITTTGKILFSNLYSAEGDLPSASTYHGMFAHVHGTGKAYFAHGGNWIKLVDEGTLPALSRANISVTDSGGDGSLAYNSSTGVITYTGPSAAEVRAHLSAGTGVGFSGGAISIGQAVATNSNVQFNNLQVDGTLTSDDITSTNIAATGNLTVSGNLTVQGTTTTVNSTTLDVVDKNLTLNYHASNDTSGNANGAGITIQDAVNASTDATLLWVAATDKFAFSHGITTPSVVATTLTATNTVSTNITASGTNILSGLTYPTSDGSSGQALVTDGSGNLSFGSISAGGNAFGRISVSGQSNVDADSNSDTLTLVAGSNITLTSNAGADSITIAAGGGGSAITVQEEGSSLSTAAGTLNFVGAGVTASGTGATKTITIPGTGTVSEAFKTIAISGQSSVVADTATDTLTLVGGSNMTLTTNASGDTITFASSGSGGGGSSQSALYKEFIFTPGSSTSTFSGSDANGATLSYTVGYISVYLNGVLLKPTTDYTASNGNSVVLVNAAGSGDVIQIATFVQIVGSGDSAVTAVTYSGSGTITLSANPNHENNTQLYIDGVYQNKDTYSISGTTLTFSTPPPNGALVEVVIGSRNVTVDDVQGLTVNGDLTVDTNTLKVDSTNNKVGIGTTSPSTPLAVHSALSSGGAMAEFRSTSNSNSVIDLRADGTGDPQIYYNLNGATVFSTGVDNSDGNKFKISANYQLGTNDRFAIDSSGNIGIGTSSPALQLHVNGAVRVDSSDGVATRKIRSSYFSSGQDLTLESGAAGDIILSSTNVGIGTTSPAVGLDVGSKTDAIRVPNGSTGQRPTAALGQLRYNTSTNEFEGYADGAWGKIGGGGDSFGTIAVSGQSNIVAEQENDTLTIVGAGGITATTTAGTDTLTLTGQTSVNPYTQDFFTASGSGSALLTYTLSVTPPSEDNLIVFVEGVYQNKNSYALSGTTLTLDSGIIVGQEVVVHIIQNGVVGAGHIVDEFVGDGSDTTFTLSVTPLNENNTFVYLDGVYQEKSVYSVSGTTLTFATAPVSGHSIEVVTPQVSEINQPAAASIDNVNMFDDTAVMGSAVTSTTLTTTSASTIATHAIATYRSVNYQVQVTQGTDYHMTTVNVIHDGTTAHFTEYGTVFDNAALGTFDATITSGNLLLQITPGSNASLTTKVVSTAIPV